MKIRKLNILLAASFGLIAFAGCKKDDGPIPSEVEITAVPTVTTNIDATGSQSINMLNLAAFQGKFKVSNYFEGTAAPTKVDIVVRKNASNANVKMFKADVTSLPANFTVTVAELTALFGAAPVLGDRYDFAPDIYLGSKKYEAFPATGIGTGSGPIGQPGFGEYARFAAICAYDPTIYEGNFVVVADDGGDYAPGNVIVLTRVSATSFSFLHKETVDPKPVLITVNTGNNQASVARTSIGSKWTWDTRPGAFMFTTNNPAASSFVAPCDKTVTLAITYGIDAGNFGGTYAFVLRKQ